MSPLTRTLVERLGRHKPRYLTEAQTCAVIKRMIRYAVQGERGCCLWIGPVNNDCYARLNVRIDGEVRSLYLHQLAFEMAHDPRQRPHWIHVGHSCDRPPCFHPEHLRKERMKDNCRRSAENTNRKRWRQHARRAAA